MTQKRQTQTKAAIKTALTQLLQEVGFEQLTVRQLCQRAGINRGTFYLHYQDKFDLMEQLKEVTLTQLRTFFIENQEHNVHLVLVLEYIKENYDFIYALSQSNYLNFKATIREFMLQLFQREDPADLEAFLGRNFPISQKYALECVLSLVEGIINLWVSSGAKESPQEIRDIFSKVIDFTNW